MHGNRTQDQHRRARGALERAAPQDGDLGLARASSSSRSASAAPSARRSSSHDADPFTGESGRAEQTLDDAGLTTPAAREVLVQSQARLDRRRPRVPRRGRATSTARLDGVPSTSTNVAVAARAGGGADLRGRPLGARRLRDHRRRRLEAAATRRPGARRGRRGPDGATRSSGSSSSATPAPTRRSNETFRTTSSKAEMLSLPITLLILLVAFGALVAAGVPLLLGAHRGAGDDRPGRPIPSQLFPVDDVDQRGDPADRPRGRRRLLAVLPAPRARGAGARARSPQAALQAAAATSGRAVLVSGLTVMIAMAGMFLTGDATFRRSPIGTILVVAVAMIGSLTVLPAVLSWLGDRVEKGRVPFLGAGAGAPAASRASGAAILDRVLRRPLVVGGRSPAALLVALAIPALRHAHRATRASTDLPQDLAGRCRPTTASRTAFPGEADAGRGRRQADDVHDAAGRRGDRRAAARRRSRPALMHEPGRRRRTARDGTRRRRSTIPIAGRRHRRRVERRRSTTLRDDIVPATVGSVRRRRRRRRPASTAELEGLQRHDEVARCRSSSRSCSALAFLLLLVTFRSIVIPIKAIVLNLLSVGAAYGVLVLVFQDGHGESLLGFQSTGGDHLVAAAVPVRGPVRALDGLPRVHPQPDPRGRTTAA